MLQFAINSKLQERSADGEDHAGFAGETHVAIVRLLAHRHGEANAERADEVLVLVAVEDERVDDADRILPGEGNCLTRSSGSEGMRSGGVEV